MTVQESIEYIERYTWSATKLGLERTQALLSALGDPQKELKFVHVAGSNGKGSTCAMLESILRRAGYRTGLYISPYIQDFCERMQVNGENIPGETLASITDRVRRVADQMEDHPSQFELVTAIAMVYFRQAGCDLVVLEVGMGGALDSTNVIDAPEVAVITNLGLEHTEYLGHTLGEIAEAKGGIIKPGCQVVCYDCPSEAMEVIARICAEKQASLHCADFSQITPLGRSLSGQEFVWRDQRLRLPLLGRHQLHNAAVVLETVAALRRRGWHIDEDAVGEGLAQVKWPARFEVLSASPLFILDGGHNPQCAQALADNLTDFFPGEKVTFLMGVLKDKDYGAILDLLSPYAAQVVCLTPDSPRAMAARDLAEEVGKRCGIAATVCESPEEGIRASLSIGRPVVAFGSLYLAGGVRSAFPAAYRQWVRRAGIRARDALSPEERERLSRRVVEQIIACPEFRRAETVLIYRATRGEVRLDALETAPECAGKRLVYPLCVSDREMVALLPEGEGAWASGYCGIPEPVREKSRLVAPEELDLVLCPCTVFDEACHRMGMGAGFYDRYLPKCIHAKIGAVAFDCQKMPALPQNSWDYPMEFVWTERGRYGQEQEENGPLKPQEN
jgi:dihydrofolate synthase/folylpolyglutamate synthase